MHLLTPEEQNANMAIEIGEEAGKFKKIFNNRA